MQMGFRDSVWSAVGSLQTRLQTKRSDSAHGIAAIYERAGRIKSREPEILVGLGENYSHRAFERQKMPMKAHEDILVFSQVPHRYFPQELKPLGKVVKRGHNGDNFGKSGTENFQEFTNYPRSLLRYPLDANKLHPTQKPVALMEYLIETYTNPGELVLDNTMGSGTTGVACLNTGRRFIGIEKDPKYFEIARNRILSDEFSIAIESA
jgi:hypothetical protein